VRFSAAGRLPPRISAHCVFAACCACGSPQAAPDTDAGSIAPSAQGDDAGTARAEGNVRDGSEDRDAGTDGAQQPEGGVCTAATPEPWPQVPFCHCGNGVVDTCTVNLGQRDGPRTEDCDGEDLSGATCQSRGYAGGALSCTGSCYFDEKSCVACEPIGGPVLSCQRACIDASGAIGVSLAATGQTLGVAWLALDSHLNVSAHLAQFTSNLDLAWESPTLPDSAPGASWPDLALAASATGWLVAIRDTNASVTVYPFDTSGRASGAPHVVQGGASPAFGSRPGGLPLLTWTESNSNNGQLMLRGAIVSDDASFLTAPVDLIGNVADRGAVAAVDSGFLVAATVSRVDTVSVVHVASDGTVSVPPQASMNTTYGLALAPAELGVSLAYGSAAAPGDTLNWAKLDRTGALLAGPVLVASEKWWTGAPRVAAAGGTDTWILRATSEQSSATQGTPRLDIVRVDAQGATVGAAHTIARSTAFGAYDMVTQGQRTVVAWTVGIGNSGAETIDLATISPSR
jgi:hypothetical protein